MFQNNFKRNFTDFMIHENNKENSVKLLYIQNIRHKENE